MRNQLVFLRNGERKEIHNVAPDEMLLSYLRLREKKPGTKEGCNEGDCGACTTALGRLKNGRLVYEPVNSCIQLLGQIDSCDLVTIDDLAEGNLLHPLQQAFVDNHASQCGFCTPGIIMALFCLLHSDEKVNRHSINHWLAGNLCRCTGYRPIIDAAMAAAKKIGNDFLKSRFAKTQKTLRALQNNGDLFLGDEQMFFAAPSSLDQLCQLSNAHKDAVLIGGATDVSLWITKGLRDLPKIIHTRKVKNLDKVKVGTSKITIGGGAAYHQAFAALSDIHDDIGEVLARIGSRQIRASGTIGGNIANGSPIGDMPPLLLALGTSIELQQGKDTRNLPLEDFFIDYGKQDRRPGEILTKIIIPKLGKHERFFAHKLSKRFDQDISAIMFALKLRLSRGRIVRARLACGGMAAIPKRAKFAETALTGARLGDESAWQKAITALAKDFSPISDMRASAIYRMEACQNLLFKALYEISEREKGNQPAIHLKHFSLSGEAR